ncbi:MAG TPA: SCO family protein, partial [Thermoanaerobaculia bacterium]|nr:SCO family protein [Thermoanaerobaculia bacterium]
TRFVLAFCLLAAPLFAEPSFSPRVPDVEVVTHEGKTVRFYSDLVKGKAVAVNFIFTNCSTICPASGAMFASLQKQGDRDLHFISVSIDPGYDTPQRLTEWSKRFRSRPGWTLVTGSQDAIDAIVKAFGGPQGRPQDHNPLTIIGSDATHQWTRLYGFPGTEKVGEAVAEVMR